MHCYFYILLYLKVTVKMQAQYQNQLQFNLGVPASDSNMAVRYHRPGPIVIEKCGSTPASGSIILQTQPSKSV